MTYESAATGNWGTPTYALTLTYSKAQPRTFDRLLDTFLGADTRQRSESARSLFANLHKFLEAANREQVRRQALDARHATSQALSRHVVALGLPEHPPTPQAPTEPPTAFALLDSDALIGAPRPGPDSRIASTAAAA